MLLKLKSLLNSWANRPSGATIWQRLFPGIGDRSLVGRLVGLLLLGSVAVYLIVNIGLWWTSSRLIDDNLEKQAVRWLAELDELGTPLYASRDGKFVANIDKRIKHFPEVAFIRYYDVTGTKVLGEYGEKHEAYIPLLTPQQLEILARPASAERNYLVDRPLLRGGYLRFISPIRIKSINSGGLLNFSLDNEKAENVKIVGYLDLSIDSDYYKEQLISSMVSGSLFIALLLMIGLVFGTRIVRRALAPLTALQVPLARLARGETDVEVERAKDAEIAVICDALNTTIRALKERDETLRKMAESDPLTGLVNRSYFARMLEEEIEYVTQNGIESAVYFIDLDKFKQVNDSHGHAAGDRLLIRVAELLKSQVSEKDVVSRLGGDEFTVLARGISRECAELVVPSTSYEWMRVTEGEHTFSVTCSICSPWSARKTSDEIMSHAIRNCVEVARTQLLSYVRRAW
jgi:diguanylate cyclase (GGDEF)-like protein